MILFGLGMFNFLLFNIMLAGGWFIHTTKVTGKQLRNAQSFGPPTLIVENEVLPISQPLHLVFKRELKNGRFPANGIIQGRMVCFEVTEKSVDWEVDTKQKIINTIDLPSQSISVGRNQMRADWRVTLPPHLLSTVGESNTGDTYRFWELQVWQRIEPGLDEVSHFIVPVK